jgi:hypothetical protein
MTFKEKIEGLLNDPVFIVCNTEFEKFVKITTNVLDSHNDYIEVFVELSSEGDFLIIRDDIYISHTLRMWFGGVCKLGSEEIDVWSTEETFTGDIVKFIALMKAIDALSHTIKGVI